jgi:L-ribulose-5-phosphate 3-epimerase
MAAASSFGVNTYAFTMSHSAEACLQRLTERGYRVFELMMYPGHLWPGETDTAALRRLVERHDLRIVAVNMPNIDVNIAAAAEDMRAYSSDMLSRLVRLAGELGAEGVVIGPGKANPLFPAPASTLFDHLRTTLDHLAPLAEREGTAIHLENLPFGFLPDAAGLADALDAHGDDRIGICYDLANGHFIGEHPARGLRRVRDRLRLVHASDTTRSVYRHDAVGRGDVPFAEIAPVLAEVGYGDVTVLEIISGEPDADIDDSARRLAKLGW